MDKTYPYAASATGLGWFLTLASLLAPLFWYIGYRGHSELMIMDAFKLSRPATTAVFYGAALVLALGLPLGAFILWAGKKSVKRVILAADALIAPYGRIVMRDRRIPYASIKKATLRTLGGKRYLWMDADGGMQVLAEQLIGRGAFEEIVAEVSRRVPGH
jgi:hypothetical protein